MTPGAPGSRPTSIIDILGTASGAWPARVLLVDPALDRTVTYAQFADLVEGAADQLLGRGLSPGDRVAVLARNGLESAVAIWSCARAGLVFVGLPVDAPSARHGQLLDLVCPAVLLVQPELAGTLEGLEMADAAGVLLSSPRPWDPSRELPAEDTTYMLIPTSGTTGRPKAVRVTGKMAGYAAEFYASALGLGPQDRTAIHLPFSWVSGHLTQLAPAMHSGGSAVTMADYSAPLLVASALAHEVTWLDVVPSIWEGLLRCDGFATLTGVRLAVYGGAPAPVGTLDRVRAVLPQIELHDVYALSETCAPVTHLPDDVDRPGTVGRAVRYAELKVVDGTDRARAAGEVGEVWVRSPVVTPGYWGDAERLRLTADGWLRTGDLGWFDADGYLTMAGRAVDLVLRGGVNIYPQEVERALMGSGQLADAGAFGVPSTVAGQNVAAAVVPLPGVTVDVPALRRCVQEALGAHAVPRPLLVLDALPRNANGKLDRVALAAGESTGMRDRPEG